jgi:preprotein translocase subunit SecA
MMQKLGMEQGEAIEHRWVTKAIENAQRKVEGRNFDISKQLLEYDDVANDQRKVVYQQRDELMDAEDISENIDNLRHDVVNVLIDQYIPPNSLEEQWDVPGLTRALEEEFDVQYPIQNWLDADHELHEETLRQRILDSLKGEYADKESQVGSDNLRRFEKEIMLQILDQHWKEHLAAMDYLRQGIHLRGYAQKNPKQEYKREAFEMFSRMLDSIKHDVVAVLSRVKIRTDLPERQQHPEEFQFKHEQFNGFAPPPADGESAEPPPQGPAEQEPREQQPFVREGRKIGRNEPCPCGSGKKYKQCHGKLN